MCTKAVMEPGNEIIHQGMLKGLKEDILNNYDVLNEYGKLIGFDIDEALKAKNLTEFDSKYTASFSGFETAKKFYDFMSVRDYV